MSVSTILRSALRSTNSHSGLDYTFGWVEPGPRPGAYAGGWLRTIEPMLIMPNLTVRLGLFTP